jgi:hypothetical protein
MNIAGSANSGTNMTEPLARLSAGSNKIPMRTAIRVGTLAPPARIHRV